MTSTEIKKFQSKVINLIKDLSEFKSDNIVLDNVKERLNKNEELYLEQLNDVYNNLLMKDSLKVLKAYSRKCKKRLKENE